LIAGQAFDFYQPFVTMAEKEKEEKLFTDKLVWKLKVWSSLRS